MANVIIGKRTDDALGEIGTNSEKSNENNVHVSDVTNGKHDNNRDELDTYIGKPNGDDLEASNGTKNNVNKDVSEITKNMNDNGVAESDTITHTSSENNMDESNRTENNANEDVGEMTEKTVYKKDVVQIAKTNEKSTDNDVESTANNGMPSEKHLINSNSGGTELAV